MSDRTKYFKECQRCGKCCKVVLLEIPHLPSEDDQNLYMMRGIIRKDKTLAIPCKCMHLGDDNLCKIYKNRPNVCRKFTCEGFDEVLNEA